MSNNPERYNPEKDFDSPSYWLRLGNTNKGDLITFTVSSTMGAVGYGIFQSEVRNPITTNETLEDFFRAPPLALFMLGGAVALLAGGLIINRNVRAFIHFVRSR